MKKLFLMIVAGAVFTLSLHAQGYTTAGDGGVYSFDALSKIEGSGVVLSEEVYEVNGTVTIAQGDAFVIDSGAKVCFGDDSEVVVKGKADLRASSPTLLSRCEGATSCYGLNIQSDDVTEVSNLTFEYVGLRGGGSAGMHVSDCKFYDHNGTSSSALFLGGDGASFTVSNCEFENCQKAALGGAANYLCPVVVQNCRFTKNSQANNNIPQLNLTAAQDIVISDCIVEGDTTLNMVGGIAVANWFGTEGARLSIENCEITDNRYGIIAMGVMDVVIKNNKLVGNCHEVNPNLGGSGISLQDPYYKQNAIVTGNHIEKSLWGITIIGCGNVNLGKTEVDVDAPDYNPGGNVFVDNGNSGMLYDVYNNSSNTVHAQGNFWNVATQDSISIEDVVFHKNDLPPLGEVIFMPAGDTQAIKPALPDSEVLGQMYNLQGIAVNEKTTDRNRKHIYILNGKKIVK